MRSITTPWLATTLAFTALLSAQDARSRATEHSLAPHDKSLYFVVPPRDGKCGKKAKPAGLIVVLPGGPGTPSFLPWVENGILGAGPDDCVGVMLTAVKWNDRQNIVWPTAKSDVPGMKFTTEEYVRAVVAEVEKNYAIDPERRVVLGWSSSVPALYPLLATKDSPFDRGYLAMGIWPKAAMQKLGAVKKRRFLLDQSPDDQRTTFRHARRAYHALDQAGAVVRLVTYEGGHGWTDMPIPRIRDGLKWLLSSSKAPKPKWPLAKAASRKGKIINLLANPGFEQDLAVWDALANSGRATFEISKSEKQAGKQSLHITKTGGVPLDLLKQETELPAGKTLTVSAQIRTKGAANARIFVRIFDDDDELLHKNVALAKLPADSDWHAIKQTWSAKGAAYAVVQVMMILGGEVWLDDLKLFVGK